MGLFEHFPYTNFHGLNLDWILSKVKNHETRLTQAEADISALRGRATALEERMDTAESDIRGLAVRMTGAEGNITNLRGRMSSAESAISAHAARLSEAETSIDELETWKDGFYSHIAEESTGTIVQQASNLEVGQVDVTVIGKRAFLRIFAVASQADGAQLVLGAAYTPDPSAALMIYHEEGTGLMHPLGVRIVGPVRLLRMPSSLTPGDTYLITGDFEIA